MVVSITQFYFVLDHIWYNVCCIENRTGSLFVFLLKHLINRQRGLLYLNLGALETESNIVKYIHVGVSPLIRPLRIARVNRLYGADP